MFLNSQENGKSSRNNFILYIIFRNVTLSRLSVGCGWSGEQNMVIFGRLKVVKLTKIGLDSNIG